MYSRSMKGSLMATTLAVLWTTELRKTIRPIRPKLRGRRDKGGYGRRMRGQFCVLDPYRRQRIDAGAT